MKKITINTNILLPVAILAVGIFTGFLIVAHAQAQAPTLTSVPASVTYPIPELGSCKNEADCRVYCNKIENVDACVSFAEKNNMISSGDATQARKFAKMGTGPGGCTTKDQCESYCEDNSHINECLSFAEKNDILPADQLAEAKKVAKALSEGAQLPGGCKSKADCGQYCSDQSHMQECLSFAEKADLIPKQELEMAKKVMPLMLSGQSPGGCKTKEQCDAYCSGDGHFDECISFAEKAGLMSKEELDMAKKTGGKGPGGCSSKESCDSFCNDPAHQAECLSFAQDKGLIPPEKIQEMKAGMEKLKTSLPKAPPEVTDCLKASFGENAIAKMESGQFTPDQQAGDTIKGCFEKVAQEMMQQQSGANIQGMPQGQQMPSDIQEKIKQQFGNQQTPPSQEQIQQFKEQIQGQMQEQYKNNMPVGVEGVPSGGQIPEQFKSMQAPPSAGQIEEFKKQAEDQYKSQMQNSQSGPPSETQTPQIPSGVQIPQIPSGVQIPQVQNGQPPETGGPMPAPNQ